MIYKQDIRVGIEDLGSEAVANTKAILTYMEDIACAHSAMVGYGIKDVPIKKRVWMVLDWRFTIKRRPEYNEVIKASTWSRRMDGIRGFRDFELLDEQGNVVAYGTSKWILTDTESKRPVRITDDISSLYETEADRAMYEEEIADIAVNNALLEVAFATGVQISRRDIDINNHVHNISYLDLALEAMPEAVYKKFKDGEYQQYHISYKREIKQGQQVAVRYYVDRGRHYVMFMVDGRVHVSMEFYDEI